MSSKRSSKANPALSNVKFIFYQYDVEGIQEQLELIDTVLRDIAYEVPEPESPAPKVAETAVNEKVEAQKETENKPVMPKKDFILSVPYKISPAVVSQTIRTAAGMYFQNHQEKNQTCGHCNSIEVIQQDHLCQLSEWRKRTMNRFSPLSKHSVLNRRRVLQKQQP